VIRLCPYQRQPLGYYIGTVSNRGSKETIERYMEEQARKPQESQLKLFDLK
jgi:hypothetical protein